jgi:hypothetical protein
MQNIIVRNSRIFIGFLIAIGMLFVIVGLGFIIAWWAGSWVLSSSKLWIFWVFEFFAIGIGGTIVISQIINFARPFVMFRTDDLGVYFGTGMRYEPYFAAWEEVESTSVYKNPNFSMFSLVKNTDSVVIAFKQDGKMPASMATSAGIIYSSYNLTLDGDYIDKSAAMIVHAVNENLEFLKKK